MSIVYFVQEIGRGPIKVGWTEHRAAARLAELQTGNPRELVLLGTMLIPQAGDAKRLERELHNRLWRHRLAGEWFEPVPELVDLAKFASRYRGGVTFEDAVRLLGVEDTPAERFAANFRARNGSS